MKTTAKKNADRRGERRTLFILGALLTLAAVVSAETVLAGSTSGAMSVSVTVQARALLNVESQPSSLVVTGADLARGWIEAPAASRIRVRSNDPNGYLLNFDVAGEPFTGIEVRGLGPAAQISPNGGWVTQPFAGTQPVTTELTYRFVLASNVQPGTYAWPVSLSVTPR